MTTQATTLSDPDVLALAVADAPRTEVGPGCYRRDLPSRQGIRLWMVEMDPGAQWPRVDHHDANGEDIYVVDGELIEGSKRFPAGSFLAFAPDSSHRPRTETGVVLFGLNRLEHASGQLATGE